jgi:hypothetical protein
MRDRTTNSCLTGQPSHTWAFGRPGHCRDYPQLHRKKSIDKCERSKYCAFQAFLGEKASIVSTPIEGDPHHRGNTVYSRCSTSPHIRAEGSYFDRRPIPCEPEERERRLQKGRRDGVGHSRPRPGQSGSGEGGAALCPDHFRGGAMGPDLFPELVEVQILMHVNQGCVGCCTDKCIASHGGAVHDNDQSKDCQPKGATDIAAAIQAQLCPGQD